MAKYRKEIYYDGTDLNDEGYPKRKYRKIPVELEPGEFGNGFGTMSTDDFFHSIGRSLDSLHNRLKKLEEKK